MAMRPVLMTSNPIKPLITVMQPMYAAYVNLTEIANFEKIKSNLFGTIQSRGNSQVILTVNSHWHLTGTSDVNQLDLANGHIHLNSADNSNNETKYNTLSVNNL